MMIMVFS